MCALISICARLIRVLILNKLLNLKTKYLALCLSFKSNQTFNHGVYFKKRIVEISGLEVITSFLFKFLDLKN